MIGWILESIAVHNVIVLISHENFFNRQTKLKLLNKFKRFSDAPQISDEHNTENSNEILPDAMEPQISIVSHTGQQLADAREKLGMSIANVASALCLSESVVKAIEAREYDQLYGKAYTTGYVRSYASLVKLDADELIERDSYLGVVEVEENGGEFEPGSLFYKSPESTSRNWVSLGIKSLIVFTTITLLIFGWHNREMISTFWYENVVNKENDQADPDSPSSAIPAPGDSNSDTSST